MRLLRVHRCIALPFCECFRGGRCAITKMGWLLGTGMAPAEVRKTMTRSLRGELTESSPEPVEILQG